MEHQVTSRMYLQRKQVDDVMGGEDSWKNVDSTEGMKALHVSILHGQLLVPSVRMIAPILCSCRSGLRTSRVCIFLEMAC